MFLVKLEFSGQIFEKYSSIKFHEHSGSGSRVVPSFFKKHCVSVTDTNVLMLFWEIIVYTLRIDKHMKKLCRKSAEFLTRKLMILSCSGHGDVMD